MEEDEYGPDLLGPGALRSQTSLAIDNKMMLAVCYQSM